MTETKKIYESKAVRGFALGILATILQSYNIELYDIIGADQETIIYTAMQVIGYIIGLYGRLTAKKEIAL